MALKVGDLLQNSRYRVVEYIDSGGFGAVYKAVDRNFRGHPVAIKVNAPQLPPAHTPSDEIRQQRHLAEARRRFEEEAMLLRALEHPNLPRVTDYFDEPGVGLCMVMDFIEGDSLAKLLEDRGGPLPEADALYYAREVADALDYLHSREQAIVHRDVKPANVILRRHDNRVFLVDFGVAKTYLGGDPLSGLPRGVSAGYSPPEQYDPNEPSTPRSDIYALGATLYRLLTYDGHDMPASTTRISRPEVTPPTHRRNPAVSRRTSDAVMWAMSLQAGDRPRDVARWLARLPESAAPPREETELRQPPDETVHATAPPETTAQRPPKREPQKPRRPVNPNRRWLILGALIVLLGLGGVGRFLIFREDEEPPAPLVATQPTEGQAGAAPTTATTYPPAVATTSATTPPTDDAPAPIETAPVGEIIHIAQAGENLYRIGLIYGFTQNELAAYNNIANPDRLEVGQPIRIPARDSQPEPTDSEEPEPTPTATDTATATSTTEPPTARPPTAAPATATAEPAATAVQPTQTQPAGPITDVFYPGAKVFFTLVGPITEQNRHLYTTRNGEPSNQLQPPYILTAGSAMYVFARIIDSDCSGFSNCFGRVDIYKSGQKVVSNGDLWSYHPYQFGAYEYKFREAGDYSAIVYFCDKGKYDCLAGQGWQASTPFQIQVN